MPQASLTRSLGRSRIVAFCLLGWLLSSPAAAWPADTTPLTTPVVTDTGSTTTSGVELSFSSVSSDPESGIVACEWVIHQDSVSSGPIAGFGSSACPSSWSYTATGLILQAGKTYYIEVKAQNGAGLWSAPGYSNGIYLLPDTTPPTVTITQPAAGATVPASGFTLQGTASDNYGISQVLVNVFDIASGTYTLSGALASYNYNAASGAWTFSILPQHLKPGNQMMVSVAAIDTQFHPSGSAVVTVTVQSTIDTTPPTIPVVTDDGPYTSSTSQLHASWTSHDPESGIAEYQYQIHRDSPTGPLVIDWTSTGTTPSVTQNGFVTGVGKERIVGLFNGHLYYFTVKAQDGAGLWSAVGSSDGIKVDKTPPAAVTVTDDGATTTSSTRLHAMWTASTDAESGISEYQYQIRRDSTTGALIKDWTSAGTNTQVTATGLALTNTTTYNVGVRAINGAGLPSDPAFSDGILVQAPDTTPPTAPGKPTTGSAYDNDGAYTVTWAAAADPESGVSTYELQERIDTTGSWTTLSSTIAGTSVAVTGRLNGNTYFYQVRAKNGAGLVGSFSQISDGTTVDTQAPHVSLIGVTNITSTGAVLNWTTNEPATCRVACGTAPSPSTSCALTSLGTAHTATLTGLAGDTTSYVDVSCQDPAGNVSAMSSTSFKTLPIVVPASPSVVTINGRQLLLQKRNPDGTLGPPAPYIIRGVDWSPAGKTTGSGGIASVRRPEFGKWYLTDIPLMKAMHVNTVRTFFDLGLPGDTGVTVDGKAILDEFYRNGIMVIMTVDDGIANAARVPQALAYYKNHPAILAWSLGSEWNINLFFAQPQPTLDDADQRIEDEAATIKVNDTLHPVISSYGEFDLFQAIGFSKLNQFVNRPGSKVDIWSFNLYRGDTFGALWAEWTNVSPKPLLLAEFGVDAWHATQLINQNPPGAVNEAEQAQGDVNLWNDIARHLSANDPSKPALGGTIFEWNDEWWKTGSPAVQESSGWFSEGFPDGMGNEEYFGLVDINRHPRSVYTTLQTTYDPATVSPALSKTFTVRAYSAGSTVPATNYENGIAKLYQGKTLLLARSGGAGGGRGFNVAAISGMTGELLHPPQNFDTWGTVGAKTALVNFLNSQPSGTIFLIAVGDEGGLTQFPPNGCTPRSDSEPVYQALAALGSTQIRSYCYWDSWAMIAVKGEGVARSEHLGKAVIGNGVDATAEATMTLL